MTEKKKAQGTASVRLGGCEQLLGLGQEEGGAVRVWQL